MMLELATLLLFLAIWAPIVCFFGFREKRSPRFLVAFSLFFFYLYAVLDLTLFQFQALLILKVFNPDLILRGLPAGQEINLVPLVTLGPADLKTSLLNVLMMVPFGFGLPFLSKATFGRVLTWGGLTSLGIEVLQFASGWVAGTSFRVADVNDVIFNTLGVLLGYSLFSLTRQMKS